MGQTERLYKIKSQLDAGRCLQKAVLEEFNISPATLKRDLAHLRDRMNAPVVFDRERNGWRLEAAAQGAGTQYELPGPWLSAEEIHALLTMQHLLANLDTGGLLGPHIAPLTDARGACDSGPTRKQHHARRGAVRRGASCREHHCLARGLGRRHRAGKALGRGMLSLASMLPVEVS